jgi:predicted membrane chloride channel (bestrophin family)
MIAQGQRNRLLLANRAIAAYQRYKEARTIELSLVS